MGTLQNLVTLHLLLLVIYESMQHDLTEIDMICYKTNHNGICMIYVQYFVTQNKVLQLIILANFWNWIFFGKQGWQIHLKIVLSLIS